MIVKTPNFWWSKKRALRLLLRPFGAVYGLIANHNMKKSNNPKIDLPVLCIGNFTLGGAGKTPVAIALAIEAKKLGLQPGIVSRGYGGQYDNMHIVNAQNDTADKVGDEPLLLARHAQVALSPNRYLGARKLQEIGCNFIIMDDGFQSRRLYMDYALLVVDALRGFGNQAVFPAGPLRAPLRTQLVYTDSVLVVGQGHAMVSVIDHLKTVKMPLHFGHLIPKSIQDVNAKKFLAFAGIGNPDKFFKSIVELGGIVEKTMVFADHHVFNDKDIDDIIHAAKTDNLLLATTAKDFVRLEASNQNTKLKNLVVFDVELAFDEENFCQNLLLEVISRFERRYSSL